MVNDHGIGKTIRPRVTIRRMADDPICPRVTTGGSLKIGGFYCVYRGTRNEAITVLENVLMELNRMPRDLPISPDEVINPV